MKQIIKDDVTASGAAVIDDHHHPHLTRHPHHPHHPFVIVRSGRSSFNNQSALN